MNDEEKFPWFGFILGVAWAGTIAMSNMLVSHHNQSKNRAAIERASAIATISNTCYQVASEKIAQTNAINWVYVSTLENTIKAYKNLEQAREDFIQQQARTAQLLVEHPSLQKTN